MFILSARAAFRIERGLNQALSRSTFTVLPEISVSPPPMMPARAMARPASAMTRIESFLGAAVDDAIVERIFKRLDFKAERNSDGWTVQPPTFRLDINTEQDLLEEIARHHGFDKFQATLPEWRGYGSALPNEAEERLLRNVLMGSGYTEVYNYSFSDAQAEQPFAPAAEPVKLMNPMSEDEAILRTTLVPGMIKSIQWNLNRGLRDVQFYELSKVYAKGTENRSLLLASTGGGRDFFDLKGDVETILETFDLDTDLDATNLPPYYHPGRAARLGKVALFGELHPDNAENLKIRQRVYLAEFDVEAILSAKLRRQINPVPRFPPVRRDFSLLLNKGTQYGDVQKIIADAGIPEIVKVEPFDRLDSGSFPETKYSLAISVIYRSAERTLTDAEVEKFDSKILELLSQRLNAELRK